MAPDGNLEACILVAQTTATEIRLVSQKVDSFKTEMIQHSFVTGSAHKLRFGFGFVILFKPFLRYDSDSGVIL